MVSIDILDLLKDRARRGGWQDRRAYSEEGRGQELTHAQVFACAEHFAARLSEAGVRPEDRVALVVGDRLEWPVAFLACARLGALAVLVNPDAAPATQEEAWRLGDVDVLLAWEAGTVRLRDRATGAERGVWSLDEAVRDPSPVRFRDDHPDGDELSDVPLYLQFSSGTTGRPKAVVHRSRDLLQFHRTVGESALELVPEDVLCSVSQFYFTYGFNNQFVYPLFAGCSAVLRPARRRAEDVAAALTDWRVTVLFSVPSALASLPRVLSAERSPGAVRAVVSAGERLPEFVERAVGAAVGAPVLEQLGCTELGNAITANGVRARSASSCGYPCEGVEVRIRPPARSDVASAAAEAGVSVGELWVRCSTIPSHADTAQGPVALTDSDGWMHTGDLAHWNEDGALVVVGRSDDIVLVGGISLSAIRVEECLRSVGLVDDVAVTSCVGADGRSSLTALIVGQDADDISVRGALEARCREELEHYCVPRTFLTVEAIPRTPSGKIRRHLVAELAAGAMVTEEQK